MEAVFLLGVGYTTDTTTAIICLTLAVGFSGFAISGKLVSTFFFKYLLQEGYCMPIFIR